MTAIVNVVKAKLNIALIGIFLIENDIKRFLYLYLFLSNLLSRPLQTHVK